MNGIDDRCLKAPFNGLDGERLSGSQVLDIRDAITASNAQTDEEIDAVIHAELAKLQKREKAGAS